jgi:hypothetical protein
MDASIEAGAALEKRVVLRPLIEKIEYLERLTKPSGQGASSKTVR